MAELIVLAERAFKGTAGKKYGAGTFFTGNWRLFPEMKTCPTNAQFTALPAKTTGDRVEIEVAVYPAFPGTEGTITVIIHVFRNIRVRQAGVKGSGFWPTGRPLLSPAISATIDKNSGIGLFIRTQAGVMKLVDVPDSKSGGPCARVGSTPTAGINYPAGK